MDYRQGRIIMFKTMDLGGAVLVFVFVSLIALLYWLPIGGE
jgi:hypothetical protein